LFSVLLVGCARYPAIVTPGAGKRLVITFELAAEVNPNYVYIVAFNPSVDVNPPVIGPIPVIAPPWGNGFVAGTATHFVRWDSFQSPRYLLYAFRAANLLEYFPIGSPVNFVEVPPGGRRFQFELDLVQIAGGTPVADLKSLQVNILTMNVVPQGTGGNKVWDALGDGRLPSGVNEYIKIPLTVNGVHNNTTFLGLEPQGDVIDPGLDIVDWQIEVRD
jgi:hypothetical protein